MVVSLIAAAVLALHGAPWKHVVVTRTSAGISATLAYDARPGFDHEQQLRHATLLVRRGTALLAARKLGTSGSGHIALVLRDVWGDAEPEALVRLRGCGNRCGYALYVGIARAGRILFHEFGVEFPKGGAPGWSIERHDGVSEFVTDDSRFFCAFTDCASSTMPVQVLRIDSDGRRFVDISRTRPDLLLPDARSLWAGYLQEHTHPYASGTTYNWYGTFVPYCADEYRLGVTAYCDRVLSASVKRQLAAWGYR